MGQINERNIIHGEYSKCQVLSNFQLGVGGGGGFWTKSQNRVNCDFLPAATKLGQGNVFTGVCDSVHGGGGLVPGGLQFFRGVFKFFGGLQFLGGVLQIFWGGSPIFRGGSPNFWGVSNFLVGGLQIFLGGSPIFLGVSKFFLGGFSNFSGGLPNFPPSPPIRLMSGRYASYWNAFLFNTNLSHCS